MNFGSALLRKKLIATKIEFWGTCSTILCSTIDSEWCKSDLKSLGQHNKLCFKYSRTCISTLYFTIWPMWPSQLNTILKAHIETKPLSRLTFFPCNKYSYIHTSNTKTAYKILSQKVYLNQFRLPELHP